MDIERINTAVKIALTLSHMKSKHGKVYESLYRDLVRLEDDLSSEEFTQYRRRLE